MGVRTMNDVRHTILENAKVLFLRYGIRSVTMDDVARGLGMSKKTLYQHFTNKKDLLAHIVSEFIAKDTKKVAQILATAQDAIEELVRMAQSATDDLRQLMSPTALYDLEKYYPELWTQINGLMIEGVYQMVYNNLLRGMREGLYRSEIDADIIAKLYVSKTNSVLDESLFPTGKYDKVQLFEQYFIYHIHGIATPRGFERLAEIFGARETLRALSP